MTFRCLLGHRWEYFVHLCHEFRGHRLPPPLPTKIPKIDVSISRRCSRCKEVQIPSAFTLTQSVEVKDRSLLQDEEQPENPTT